MGILMRDGGTPTPGELSAAVKLLTAEGIRRDGNLDYTCGLFDDDYELIGTGSCFGNTLRCMAVSRDHQGEGLLAQIITHLMDVQFTRGNPHLFVYTKCDSEKFFKDLGITCRAVGEEPLSLVTGIYNRIMQEELPKAGVSVDIIPRFETGGKPVSASDVRSALKKGDMQKLAALVPASTRRYFESPEAAPVIARIRAADNVVHY